MPRWVSTLRIDQALAAARSFHESPSQVSLPNSPFCATVWKIQTCLPVRASNARTSPFGPRGSPSEVSDPQITRSL